MSSIRTLDDAAVDGKRVLVRVDFNVPVRDGAVSDASRIEGAAPTIRELADKGAKVILLAHFGRPKGKRVDSESLAPIVETVARVVGRPVGFADDCIGDVAAAAIGNMVPGEILLLENTRFHPGEEKNDTAFVAELAANGDVFVNDAFSAAHRAHASTEGLAHKLPAYAGRAMEAEIEALTKACEQPERPVVAIVGGAKVSTKIALLENLCEKMDAIVIGGAMANTFVAAHGGDVGKSLYEPDQADLARRIVARGEETGCTIVLPKDATVAREFKEGAESWDVGLDAMPDDAMILDLGPHSIDTVKAEIGTAKTLLWNGPLGAFEVPPFDRATVEVARHAAELTAAGKLTSVAGGGDTLAAMHHAGVAEKMTYVSMAGGAFLEWLEGKSLPGVAVLKK
ncbi:phosphoglycerate kinase [Amorphus orientalis]|uniref:Phosphoglycerate kinase n=1 Tax=Amorphus orientalis TaxID=649198 RepID=A0AAE3VRV0_9HYPH|nr:phosphoglycerate kinase [Amorphus orientalis]MDQ0316981.1 phosphoglycerate kinase [Amorphus orientalis]